MIVYTLYLLEPQIVVGVVGLGHVAGIKKYWETITKEQARELMMYVITYLFIIVKISEMYSYLKILYYFNIN